MSPLVREQKAILKEWLYKMIHEQTAPCPHCQKECSRLINDKVNPDRPQFICTHCNTSFNPLAKTPFSRMHFIELWLPYIGLLSEGLSHAEIDRQLGVSRKSLVYWRRNFLKPIDIMQLGALKQWISWQKSRYQFVASSKKRRTH